MVRSREVAFQREVVLEDLVVMELRAVVQGEGFKVSSAFSDSGKCSLGNGVGCSGVQFFDDDEPGFAFNKSEDAVVTVAADQGISLPVSEHFTRLDFIRVS